jgi:hypothetical protein
MQDWQPQNPSRVVFSDLSPQKKDSFLDFLAQKDIDFQYIPTNAIGNPTSPTHALSYDANARTAAGSSATGSEMRIGASAGISDSGSILLRDGTKKEGLSFAKQNDPQKGFVARVRMQHKGTKADLQRQYGENYEERLKVKTGNFLPLERTPSQRRLVKTGSFLPLERTPSQRTSRPFDGYTYTAEPDRDGHSRGTNRTGGTAQIQQIQKTQTGDPTDSENPNRADPTDDPNRSYASILEDTTEEFHSAHPLRLPPDAAMSSKPAAMGSGSFESKRLPRPAKGPTIRRRFNDGSQVG